MDSDYAKGELVIKEFKNLSKSASGEVYSEPIMVEGVCYRLIVYLRGLGEGADNYISVGVQRNKLACLNLDTSD